MFDGAGDLGRFHLGDAEFAGGDIDVSHAGASIRARHRGQIVVLMRAQQVGVRGGAGRDDARDLAPHQFLGQPGSSIWSQMATR